MNSLFPEIIFENNFLRDCRKCIKLINSAFSPTISSHPQLFLRSAIGCLLVWVTEGREKLHKHPENKSNNSYNKKKEFELF